MRRLLLYGALAIFKITPFCLLYLLSDGLYFVLYYLVRLRRKIVRANLSFVFPSFSHEKLISIEKKSYRNLCDVILETFKGYTLSPKAMAKRYIITNPEMLNRYLDQGRSLVGFAGHMNNWEWGTSLQQHLTHKAVYVYKRIHNRTIDDFARRQRERYGAELVYKEQISRFLIKHRRTPCFYVLIADQRPSNDQEKREVQFFNRKITCFAGPELIAKTFNFPVVYCKIERVARGFYQATGILITENPKDTADGEISQHCMSLLQKQIEETPENWMWLHKRFKNKDCV